MKLPGIRWVEDHIDGNATQLFTILAALTSQPYGAVLISGFTQKEYFPLSPLITYSRKATDSQNPNEPAARTRSDDVIQVEYNRRRRRHKVYFPSEYSFCQTDVQIY